MDRAFCSFCVGVGVCVSIEFDFPGFIKAKWEQIHTVQALINDCYVIHF